LPEAVSNTSPLIALSSIEALGLLHSAFGMVAVPPAVYHEVVERGAGRPGAVEVARARSEGWLTVESSTNEALIAALAGELDRREAEAIALAAERQPAIVLLDETKARAAAARLGLPLTGTVGILLRAKVRGEVAAVRPLLETARAIVGFRLSDPVYTRVLREAGESMM